MPGNKGLDELGDYLLLAPRKFGSGFENLLEPSHGGGALGSRWFDSEQLVDACPKYSRKVWQHFAPRWCATELPKANVGRVNADLFSQLHLGQASGLPQFGDALAKGRSGFSCHAARILRGENGGKGLQIF